MSISTNEFIRKMEKDNEALFQASEMQVEAFFRSNPSKEDLIEHFSGRCANEHMNLIEVAKRLLEIAQNGDREKIKLLAKQVLDEANHFDLVARVVERIAGAELNTANLLETEKSGGGAKGARILESMDSQDQLALSLYQFIAEGRAARVWQRMAEVCADPMISEAYARIVRDEAVHREFGRIGLEQSLALDADRARALELADQIRYELYKVSCLNCVEVPEARALCVSSYGSRFLN